MEKHIQTTIGAVMVALLMWVGYSISEMSKSVARLEVQVDNLQQEVKRLQGDRYTKADSARDLGAVYKTLEDHTERLRSLEQRAVGVAGP